MLSCDAMRADGTKKLQRADLEDSARTQTRSRKPKEPSQPPANDSMHVQTNAEDAPTEPLGDGVANDETPHEHEPIIVDETPNFYEEVNDALEVGWGDKDLRDSEGDHLMSPLVDVLQTLGVSASDAVAYSVYVIKNRPHRPMSFGSTYNYTMMEVCGKGHIVAASHGYRRSLNIDGLQAVDLRNVKSDGEPWDFSKTVDRRLARRIEKPAWLTGSPPCTCSVHGNKHKS